MFLSCSLLYGKPRQLGRAPMTRPVTPWGGPETARLNRWPWALAPGRAHLYGGPIAGGSK